MTVPASPSHNEYTGDGATVTFVYDFKIASSSELEVRRGGTVDTETVDYSVAGVGNDAGTITYYSAPASGTVIALRRVVPHEQLLEITANGPLPSQALSLRLDQIVKMIQQHDEELSRKIGFPPGAKALRRDLAFPEPGALKVVGWDAIEGLTLFDTALFQVTPDPVSGISEGITTIEALAAPNAGQWIITLSAGLPVGTEIAEVLYYCAIDFDTSNGLSSVDIGGLGITDGWGQTIGITAGTITTPANRRRGDHPTMQTAGDIILSANGGPFGGSGQAILSVYWKTYTARTTL